MCLLVRNQFEGFKFLFDHASQNDSKKNLFFISMSFPLPSFLLPVASRMSSRLLLCLRAVCIIALAGVASSWELNQLYYRHLRKDFLFMKVISDAHAQKKKGLQGARPVQLRFGDEGIYVLDYGMGAFALALSVQFGLVGMLIYNFLLGRTRRKKTAEFETASVEQVVSESDHSYFFPYQQIARYKLESGRWKRYKGQNGIYIWVDEIEYRLFVPINQFDEVSSMVSSKLSGREVQN